MGAWSTDTFGNDDACDWTYGLAGVDDLSLVEAAFAAIEAVPAGKPLPAASMREAIAAVEVLARLRGHEGFRNAYTSSADDWVARTRVVPPVPLVERAAAVLRRGVGEGSELRAQWDKAGGPAASQWRKVVRELTVRLAHEPRPLAAPAHVPSPAPAPELEPVPLPPPAPVLAPIPIPVPTPEPEPTPALETTFLPDIRPPAATTTPDPEDESFVSTGPLDYGPPPSLIAPTAPPAAPSRPPSWWNALVAWWRRLAGA